jgi:hypothetical protein
LQEREERIGGPVPARLKRGFRNSSGRLKAGWFFVIEAIVVSQVVEPLELDDNGKIMSSFLSHDGYVSLEIAAPQ